MTNKYLKAIHSRKYLKFIKVVLLFLTTYLGAILFSICILFYFVFVILWVILDWLKSSIRDLIEDLKWNLKGFKGFHCIRFIRQNALKMYNEVVELEILVS